MTSFDNEDINFGTMKNSRHSTYYIFKTQKWNFQNISKLLTSKKPNKQTLAKKKKKRSQTNIPAVKVPVLIYLIKWKQKFIEPRKQTYFAGPVYRRESCSPP